MRDLTAGASFVYRATRVTFQEQEARWGFPNSSVSGDPEYTDFSVFGIAPEAQVSLYFRSAVYQSGHDDPRAESAVLEGLTLLRGDISIRNSQGFAMGGPTFWLRQDNSGGSDALYLVRPVALVFAPTAALTATPGSLVVPGTFTVGASLSANLPVMLPGGVLTRTSVYSLHVDSGPSSITVPAGTFTDCYACTFRLPEGNLEMDTSIPGTIGTHTANYLTGTVWFSPTVGWFVKANVGRRYEDDVLDKGFGHLAQVWELEAFS